MDSQLQCPVCTLYLHAGINLQDHLETHPKDKVISALVNLTLTKDQDTFPNANENYYYEDAYESQSLQAAGTPVAANNLMLTRALPAASETRAFATYYTPMQQPTAARQVMIVDRTRVFHGASAESDIPRRRMISKSIPSFAAASGQALQLLASSGSGQGGALYTERPPPSYYVSVQESLAKRNANLVEASQSASAEHSWPEQASERPADPYQIASGTPTTSLSEQHFPPNTNREISNEIKPQLSSAAAAPAPAQIEQDVPTASSQPNTTTQSQPDDLGELITGVPNDDEADQWVDASEKSSDRNKLGLKVLSNVKVESNVSLNVSPSTACIETPPTESYERNAVLSNLQSLLTAGEAGKSVEKRKIGLKVLSNVKVPANAVLNVSSLTPKAVSLSNMFIIGSRSAPLALTKSPPAQISMQPSTSREALEWTREAAATAMDVDTPEKAGDDKIISLDSESETEDEPKHDAVQQSCASKATSVIRLATQKTQSKLESAQRTLLMQKPIHNRAPKKLVVKLKKPFVPVIEEEANLHPPEHTNEPIASNSGAFTVKTEPKAGNGDASADSVVKAEPSATKHDLDLTLECSEDVPFSPLRQSYTPLPRIQISTSNEGAAPEAAMSPAPKPEEKKPPSGYSQAQEFVVFEISIKDGKASTEIDLLRETANSICSSSATSASTSNSLSSSSSSSASSSSSSASSSSSNSAAPSTSQTNFSQSVSVRADYGLPAFLDYNNDQNNEDYLYSAVNLSPLPLGNDADNWSQRFSPQYTSFEMEKHNSYVDLDGCKTSSNGERAPSTDSLNIRTDEKMPAKGEISEQESNGDVEGSWSHQVRVDLPQHITSDTEAHFPFIIMIADVLRSRQFAALHQLLRHDRGQGELESQQRAQCDPRNREYVDDSLQNVRSINFEI